MSIFRFLISVAALLTSEGLLVQGPAQPLVAQLGGSIILPCSVETPLPLDGLEIQWKRTDEEAFVHLFQDGRDRPEAQHQSYRDRAHFASEQIVKGNFSILLENITVADTGIYRCVVSSDQNVGEISVIIQHVGMSALHIITLILCFISLLLTFVLSIPVTIYINKKDTGPKPMYINYLLVVCPNICLSIAFVLWGVIEGSVVEVTMCATVNLSRIILLFLMAPYFNWDTAVSVNFPGCIHRMIEFLAIPIAYLLISTAFCSAVLHDLWNTSKWTEVVLLSFGIILLSAMPAVFQALNNVCFARFFDIHMSVRFILESLGHVSMQSSNFLQMRLLFYRSSSVDESMITMTYAFGGISAAISLIVLPIPAIRQYLCSKLGTYQLRMLIWRCKRFGWIFVTVMLHILTAISPTRFPRKVPDVIYTTLFMYGVAGLPVVNSVSLATELILQEYKGERTVDDLRVIVLAFESIMPGVWLVLQIHAYWAVSGRSVQREVYALMDFVSQCTPQQRDIGESDFSENQLSEIQRSQQEEETFLGEPDLEV